MLVTFKLIVTFLFYCSIFSSD